MHAAVAGLTAAGLSIGLNVTHGVLDITATPEAPGRKPVQVVLDEDGYVQSATGQDLSGPVGKRP